uniref:Matrix remodeling associated 5 n=1 Tax=Tetraodon nigroviridis TaxID=99883 RepID=H3BVK1_TETNG
LLRAVLLLMILASPGASTPCPRACSCPQPTEVHCTFRSLAVIPPAVPKYVKRMNLGFNRIHRISEKSLADLRKLELLLIHGNDIHTLPDGVFRDLQSLQLLKMSYNKLTEVSRHTLQGLWSLGRLHLDHNQLEFLHPDAFQGLTSLRLLQLEGNRLQQLHPATFATFTLMGHFQVSTLRHLYLSDNELRLLPSELVASMPQLENLYLHGNPWTCDCHMKWLHNWNKNFPDIQCCGVEYIWETCSSCKVFHDLFNKTFSSSGSAQVYSLRIVKSLSSQTFGFTKASSQLSVRKTKHFLVPGIYQLGLSDEHANEVDLECSLGYNGESTKISWEQVNSLQLASNITLSVDIECPVDRGKYERVWRLIAYYSNVPAHLQRGIMLSKEPYPTYVYRQDSERDALYYTGIKVNIMAQPAWLMQTSVELQLNRLQSSAKAVKLILRTVFSEAVEVELAQRQRRSWVMIESKNITRKVLSALLGSQSELNCNVHSSGHPVIQWTLPDGSKVEAPYSSPDNRVSVSNGGQLVIKAVSHTDTGIYYCTAKVQGDFAVLPFHLTVQESSSPSPGEDVSPFQGFAGKPISLPCITFGSPDAEVYWILPSSKIVSFHGNSSRAHVLLNGTLHIPQTQLSDSGHYKCIAINQHGVDTLVTKTTLIKQNGPIPTEDNEEASGDVDPVPVNRLDPSRRRIPGLITNKKGTNPSRKTWHRPTMVRKTAGGEERKNQLGSRRKISVSKLKIDPEKWVHILAKIRDRNTQNTVTPALVQQPTASMWATTHLLKNAEDSLEGVTKYFTTTEMSVQGTEMTFLTSDSHTAVDRHSLSTNTPPHTRQASSHVKHTVPDRNMDLHATSNVEFFLPQTTSVPPDVVTLWQANTNTASSRNTDANGVKAADWWTPTEQNKRQDSNNREFSLDGNEMFPTVSPHLLQIKLEKSGKHASVTTTTLHPQSQVQESRFDGLHLKAISTTLFPTTTVPTSARRVSDRHPNSKRKNRRKRPNRRKQRLNKHTQFIATSPENVSQATVRTTASSHLKIEPFTLKASTFAATVPFRSSQTASSGMLSHKQSSPKPSVPASPSASSSSLLHEANSTIPPLAKPLLKDTSAAPLLPAVSPSVGRMNSAALGKSEVPTEPLEILASSPVQTFTGSTSLTFTPLVGIQRETLIEEVDLHPVTTVVPNQPELQHTSTEGTTFSDTDVPFSLPPQSFSTGFLSEHELTTTAEYTSRSSISKPGMQSEASVDIIQRTTVEPTVELWNHSSSYSIITSSQGRGHEEFTNAGIKITRSYTTGSSNGFSSTVAPYLVSNTPSPGGTDGSSFNVTTQPNSQDHQIRVSTTSEPRRTSEFYLTTQKSDHRLLPLPTKPAAKLFTTQTVTPTTDPFTDGQLVSAQEESRKHRQPGQGPIPRGKPRITKGSFQTFTAKAETDVQLPCEADGEPRPFLSWTKVVSGTVIAQNTRVHRFEVHPNGTLTIRNTQPMDGGEYLCKVQNQHGTDTMVANVVILSQPPLILQPRQRDVTVNLGGKIHLDCAVEGHPTPRVTWVLPNRVHVAPVPHGTPSWQHVSILSNGTLRISEAAFADRGIYKCIGSSTAGSDAVLVRVHVSGILSEVQQTQYQNITLAEGSDVYIHCNISGALQAKIRWITPDGTQLTTSQFSTGNNRVFPNGTIHIPGLTKKNTGRYECLATNSLVSSRRVVMLSLKRSLSSSKARVVFSSPQRTDVIYGESLLLDCVTTGEPTPRIIWRTPSKKLVDAQYSFDSRIMVLANGTIAIRSVTEKDSGDYLCVARNKIGDDYILLRVNVMTRPAKIKQKQQHSSQEVIYGGDLKVDCVASGLPNPEISWALPDGTMVDPVKTRDSSGGRSRRYVVFDNGTLYFNDVGMPEEGDYTCYAENKLGKDEMKVTVKVKVATNPPKIQDKKQNLVKGFYGDTVVLTCNAKGEPLPVITWISPTSRVITSTVDKHQILNDGTLIIQKVQRFDGGNYSCVARNNAGQDFKVTRLEVLVTSPVINGLSGTSNIITVTAVQDQIKFLDCVAKGTPTPRVMWLLPGNVILPAPYNSNRMTVHQNGTLEIRSLKRTDAGKLTCIARNEGGEVRLSVNLSVNEAAEKSHISGPKTQSLSLTVGSTMTLNCSSEGAHLPRVIWILPNGTPLNSGAQLSKFFNRPDGSLIITNPSVSEAGTYRCLWRDFQGLVERKITLTPGRKPEITNRYNSPISTMIGERLLLHCLTNSEPLRLTWTLPSGVVLNRPQKAGRYNVLSNGTLAIHQISTYDRGSYVCRVANHQQPPLTYAKRGVAIQLNCLATGIPSVDIAWETPDKTRLVVGAQPRLLGNKYLHPQGSLIIQSPTQRDAGMYRCTARNAVGMDSKSTFLNVF